MNEFPRDELTSATPLVSVIMATYNRAGFIRAAIESVRQQPWSSLEIIVIDDGSTDETSEVVRVLAGQTGVPIRYVPQSNCGLPAAHNHGLRLARGEVIAFLDSDDLWPPDRLPTQLVYFQAQEPGQPAPEIVLGREELFVQPGAKVNQHELATFNGYLVHYALGSSLFLRRVFNQIGGFDESLLYTADWDWFVRAREARVQVAADPRVTLRARIHGGNMTRNRSTGEHFTIQMIKKHMGRQSQGRTSIPHETE